VAEATAKELELPMLDEKLFVAVELGVLDGVLGAIVGTGKPTEGSEVTVWTDSDVILSADVKDDTKLDC